MKKILRLLNPFGWIRRVKGSTRPNYLQIRVDHLERENYALNRKLHQLMKLTGHTEYANMIMETKEADKLRKKYESC